MKQRRFVAVARVSTKDQDDGWSPDAQRAKFQEYARAHHLELVEVLSDAQSAKDLDREGLQQALAALERQEAEGLLVAKLDRLTRNVRDFEDLLTEYFRDRFTLLSCGETLDLKTAAGRMLARILVVFAQYEREVNGERTSDGLREARTQGGGAPRIEGPAETRIRELAAEGLSLRAIAKRLTQEAVPTLKGGKWAPETVRKVLARTSDSGDGTDPR